MYTYIYFTYLVVSQRVIYISIDVINYKMKDNVFPTYSDQPLVSLEHISGSTVENKAPFEYFIAHMRIYEPDVYIICKS